MSVIPKALTKVIESFQRLPGIGPKTAQRLAFYLLHVPDSELTQFADSVRNLKANTVLCSVCRHVSEKDPCSICTDPTRDQTILCVVEQPTDVLSIERTGKFRGLYHVLHGSIDPLNNIGPDEIYISQLLKRLSTSSQRIVEVILATNPTMEGEATALYIQKQLVGLQSNSTVISLTRLAHGLPVGADIEYADEVTLSRALEGRRQY